jgi:hypothetical protein
LRVQVANEPSVGLYFIQEHVRKSIPFVQATKVRCWRCWRCARGMRAVNAPSRPQHALR